MYTATRDILDVLGGPARIGRELERRLGEPFSTQRVAQWRARRVPWYVKEMLHSMLCEQIEAACKKGKMNG